MKTTQQAMRALFIARSSNGKTGPIPTTYVDEATCPPSCPHYRTTCYAEGYHTRLAWTRAAKGLDIDALAAKIQALPAGAFWRHAVAGDLPGHGETIDAAALGELVRANIGRRGFTYTHKHRSAENLTWIRHANAWGFTVNLSADNPAEADALADTKAGPVVCLVPMDAQEKSTTPAGRRIIVCPAQTRDEVTCQTCQLCQRADRSTIIGFRAHGTRAKAADAKARRVIPIKKA
jgi:hypothetical protein